MYKHNTALY